jgi:hypothetical protein
MVVPSFVSRLLFGAELMPPADAVGRISGLVMLCLAAGCWPSASEHGEPHALKRCCY